MSGLRSSLELEHYAARTDREAYTLFPSELWWRDYYDIINNRGYEFRPRYHPDWVPSWKKTGRDFFTVEDGQHCLVSALPLAPSALTYYASYGPQWMLQGDAMVNVLC
jgi:hypothetical protein